VNRQRMISPATAFIQWFDSMPVAVRKNLAHVFRVCTTEDVSQMAALPDHSLARFRSWVIKPDFPLRLAAKVFYIRAVFDMVILHQKEIKGEDGSIGLLPGTGNMVYLSDRHWEKAVDSWRILRHEALSDTYVHAWTSWMIKLQKEST
jgi:hypothetical protein